jgi:hypothetical protein
VEPELASAEQRAEQIARSLREHPDDLDAIVSAEEKAAAEVEAAGYDLRALLPATEEIGLGFRGGGRPGGRSIVRAFRDALRTDLCDPEAELCKRVNSALSVGGAGVVGLLVAALGLPAVAAALLAPVAGAILGVGLKAYCHIIEQV